MKKDNQYYSIKKEELIQKFNSSPDKGLSEEEVEKRLEEYGQNKLLKTKKVSIQEVLFRQLKDLMMILLLVTGLTAFLIGDEIEAFAILGIVVFNTLLGFMTEYKAEKSMESLKDYLTPIAKVKRSDTVKEIDAENLVPGDILILEEGDRISADGRLIQSSNLTVNESILTGESETVAKDADFNTEEELALAERVNMVYMGTTVTRGSARVMVTATGSDTEMGQIGSLLEDTEDEKTPLQERLDQLGKYLVKLTLLVTAFIIIFAGLVGIPWLETIKTGIALAIAAVPEGLPIIATVTLAIGMKKMAKNNALIRRLLAVETLGSTTTICTDKTGTITENQMTLQKVYLNDNIINITGTGYKPEGEFLKGDEKIKAEENKSLILFLKTALLCSNAVLSKEEGEDLWDIVGDPTEGALLVGARKAGYDRDKMEDEGYQRLAEIPFSSERMYMAVSYQDPDQKNYIFVKGSPSVVLDNCNSIYINGETKELKKEMKTSLENKNKEMARSGLRLLALAYKPDVKADDQEKIKNEMESGIVFLGFAGIIDPPREGVKEAIKIATSAGVKIKLITGDQSDTALSIAKETGIIENDENTISGQDISRMSSEELKDTIKNHSVFCRVSPENKLEIIDALNKSSEVTAMTGDGVNDAPALKKADIGVSMGQRGTSVARSASDMVLLNDSFDSIVKAIKEGRVIFDNIQKFIYFLFSNNLSKILYIFLGILLQVPLPLVALQILWINLVIDTFPALTLAWEAPEENIMERSPRDPSKSILNKEFARRLYLDSVIITIGPLLSYLLALNAGFPIELSRTISFTVMSFTQLFHIFDARRKTGVGFDRTLVQNKYLWITVLLTIPLQISTIYNSFMQRIFSTTAIPLDLWPLIILAFSIPVLIIQLLKFKKKARR